MFNISPRVDVVNLEWASGESRDRISATLVCNYLRMQGLNVLEGSVWDGMTLLKKYRPKLFFISNSVGAFENLELVQYAKNRNMLVVSMVAEGNLQGDDDYLNQMIWGWNHNKILVEDVNLQWSSSSKDKILGLYPSLKNRIKVSGGVGFDNYKIASNSRCVEELRANFNKLGFKKVIGIGCWDFGGFFENDTRNPVFTKLFTEAEIKRFKQDRIMFDEMLDNVIQANRDILFLLKEHPGNQLGRIASGIVKASDNKNVVVIKNEVAIVDCIKVCDMWFVYESTTAMEGWLLGKVTALINPSGRDFKRDKLNEGSPVFECSNDLNSYINKFYSGKKLEEFDNLKHRRDSLIKEVIEWDDGLNHVRAGNLILDLLKTDFKRSWVKESINEIVRRLYLHLRWLYRPMVSNSDKFNKCYSNRRNFSEIELHKFGKVKYSEQLLYYQNLGLDMKQLRNIKCG